MLLPLSSVLMYVSKSSDVANINNICALVSISVSVFTPPSPQYSVPVVLSGICLVSSTNLSFQNFY